MQLVENKHRQGGMLWKSLIQKVAMKTLSLTIMLEARFIKKTRICTNYVQLLHAPLMDHWRMKNHCWDGIDKKVLS